MDSQDPPPPLADGIFSPEDEAAFEEDAAYEQEVLATTRKDYFLAYLGKTPKATVIGQTPAYPLQEIRAFGDPISGDWRNLLISGDNLPVLRFLMDEKKAGRLRNADGTDGVRLVYIDPPFATGDRFRGGNDAIAYSDRVKGSDFIEGLRQRLILLCEVMAENGSIFVHLDWRMSHYIKAVMDEVFAESLFRNEIIWHYDQGARGKTTFGHKHDVVLWYSRSDSWLFNADQILEAYQSKMTEWRYTKGGQAGKPMPLGKIPSDVWDIKFNAMSKERTGYPTQKPEALLDRIIRACSNPGDIVLDCFAGSGTTLAVAEKMGRRWIGVEMGLNGLYQTQKRLLNIANSADLDAPEQSATNKKQRSYGQDPRPFSVLSSGHYDFDRLIALPRADYLRFVLALYNAAPVSEVINGLPIDGRDNHGDPVIVHDFHADPETVVTPETLADLAGVLRGRVRDRILFIAPSSKMPFYESRFDFDGLVVDVRRIPYSAVEAVSRMGNQPFSKAGITEILKRDVFDFVAVPDVERSIDVAARSLTVTGFYSWVVGGKMTEEQRGLPALAMVMVDYDHDGKVFDLNETYFGDDLATKGYVVPLPGARPGTDVAVIYCDGNGNERFEVIRGLPWGGA
jgi:site-specific DNA-methyltransferase (adenine-specific)/adenine-specific DNA-methyltransferase